MCMIDSCDEQFTFLDVTDRKARKAHTCAECRRVIQPGETYKRTAAVYDGRWGTWQTCAHCRVAQAWLSRECGGFLQEGVLEDLEEHMDEFWGKDSHRRLEVGRLIVGMRRDWKRFDGAGLMPVPRLKAAAPAAS